jgi:hypothetical protein
LIGGDMHPLAAEAVDGYTHTVVVES